MTTTYLNVLYVERHWFLREFAKSSIFTDFLALVRHVHEHARLRILMDFCISTGYSTLQNRHSSLLPFIIMR